MNKIDYYLVPLIVESSLKFNHSEKNSPISSYDRSVTIEMVVNKGEGKFIPN